MIDKIVYETLRWFDHIKLAKDSPLRDSMFWFIIITTIIYFGLLIWGITK
jgi:hypothetical protein